MSFTDEKVKIYSICGESTTVYRFMRVCRKCHFFTPEKGYFGKCGKFDKRVSSGFASCPDFIATEETLNDMWAETAARDGEYSKIVYKGKSYIVEHEDLVKALGFDPDETSGSRT